MKNTEASCGSRVARATLSIAFAGAVLASTGCATVQNPNANDPFEPLNRTVYRFNEGVDAAVMRPLATAYQQVVPQLVRTGVHNFFGNLGDVWSAVNSALQFKFGDAAQNILRFQVNTFFGFGGILDIASDLRIERHREDFGQTLGRWGIPAGPYLVLPFYGPSTLRDTIALPVDRRYDLLKQVDPHDTRHVLYGARVIDTRASLLRVGNMVEEAALDRYSFTRDSYLQKRRSDVREGRPDPGAGQTPREDTVPAGQPTTAPSR